MTRAALAVSLLCSACTTAGSAWMAEPLVSQAEAPEFNDDGEPLADGSPSGRLRSVTSASHQSSAGGAVRAKVIGGEEVPVEYGPDYPVLSAPERTLERSKLDGRVLGTFRNTYYDFPSEQDFKGEGVALKSAKCSTIKSVPRGFFEAVCVQGSGMLTTGSTVSFSKRDCECAEVCPRTQQRICFDALEPAQFPWGRGAMGQAITPLLTVAVDSDVIPLGTPVYVPDYDGLPRDAAGKGKHDGCFIAQDRGLRVKGKHIDVFTGQESLTRLWNQLVPSNKGVTVVLDSARCARAM